MTDPTPTAATLWRVDTQTARIDEKVGVPTWIGEYEILRVLGHGGQGVVYLARSPVGLCALKLVPSVVDSRRVRDRLAQEARLLALMNHPNIARIYNVGLTDHDSQYFVMEYINGPPVTSFARANDLSVRERAQLMIPVCEAVAHAHHRGVIHRDLKPPNILVACNGRPVPKVIDFGVSRVIGPLEGEMTTLAEEPGQAIGTLPYMSPEGMLDSSAVDARADIFSLGVVLYELFVGYRPWDLRVASNLDATASERIEKARDTILNTQPLLPSSRALQSDADVTEPRRLAAMTGNAWQPDPASGQPHASSLSESRRWTLSRELHGDLDSIVMRCLERNRDDRYKSVGALRDDLERYLADRPVLSRAPTPSYVLTKFARRKRWQISTVALAMMLIVIFCIAFPAFVLPVTVATATSILSLVMIMDEARRPHVSPAPSARMTAGTLVGLALVFGAPYVKVPAIADSYETLCEDRLPITAELVDPKQPEKRSSISSAVVPKVNGPSSAIVNEAFNVTAAIELEKSDAVLPVDHDSMVGRLRATGAVTMGLSLGGAEIDPTGPSSISQDGECWWSVAATSVGRQSGHLAVTSDNAKLNAQGLGGPIVLVTLKKDRIPFTVIIRDSSRGWIQLIMLCVGGPMVIAQMVSWIHKVVVFVGIWREKRRPKIVVST